MSSNFSLSMCLFLRFTARCFVASPFVYLYSLLLCNCTIVRCICVFKVRNQHAVRSAIDRQPFLEYFMNRYIKVE